MFRFNRIFSNIKNVRMCSSSIMSSSQKLLSAIADLDNFGIRLKNFPVMVFVGQQSSGKSSLIQAITGDYILPVDMKVATKKPTHITTLRSPTYSYKVGDRIYYSVQETAEEIDRMNRNEHVKNINVVINSPKVHNSIFIDLPGLFSISEDGSNDDFRKYVKELVLEHISDKNYTPVVVHSAPSDPANNMAIKLITKINRKNDSLGVLTKLDMIKDQKKHYIENMLNNRNYTLGYGYCAVVLPNDSDIENGVSVDDKIKMESEFFSKYPNIKPAGVPTLRKMISDIQSQKILEHIPSIIREIDSHIISLKNSDNFLTRLLSGNNQSLSKNLRAMIEKLIHSSYDRAVFEEELKMKLTQDIRKYLLESDTGYQSNTELSIPRTSSTVDTSIVSYVEQHIKNPIDLDDRFKRIFSYGSGSPIFIDNNNLNDYYKDAVNVAVYMQFIELYTDDNLGKARAEWNQQLNRYFGKLLHDETIHNIIKNTTLDMLINYIHNSADFMDPISKKFAEYMLHQIGDEAFENTIKYSITAILNLEKRPNVSAFDVIRYLLQSTPEISNIPRTLLFQPRVHKCQLKIFDNVWKKIYTNLMIDNIADNCYRNVAVNLMDKMVDKLLEMTIDMFHKENATKEKNRVNEKLKHLTNIREILQNYNDQNITKPNDTDSIIPVPQYDVDWDEMSR